MVLLYNISRRLSRLFLKFMQFFIYYPANLYYFSYFYQIILQDYVQQIAFYFSADIKPRYLRVIPICKYRG